MLYNINRNSYSKIFNQIPYLCTHCIYTHFTNMKNWINNYLCLLLFATTLLGCSKSIEMTAELSLQAEATTGEGAIWHPERESLFWVDIEGCKLYEYAPERQNCREWTFDRMVSIRLSGSTYLRTSGRLSRQSRTKTGNSDATTENAIPKAGSG